MSDENKQTIQDAARGKVCRVKQNLEATKQILAKVASEMEGVAKMLRENPGSISVSSHSWLCAEYVEAAIKDVEKVELELSDACANATANGVALP
jgi:hypothetical protein